MRLRSSISVAAIGLVGLAGCGTQNAADSASTHAKQAAQQARSSVNLSPQAQDLLERAQNLAGDVVITAKAYAAHDMTQNFAMARLKDYEARAAALASSARQLPATDRANAQIAQLTTQINQTLKSVRTQVSNGQRPAGSSASLQQLSQSATSVYHQLQSRLPQDAQRQINDALSALGV